MRTTWINTIVKRLIIALLVGGFTLGIIYFLALPATLHIYVPVLFTVSSFILLTILNAILSTFFDEPIVEKENEDILDI